ncbi:GxxExxY protein [Pedobacter rhizosphaerae]|uniref:GxxExxY protein n=1 Tax=Pedobacter rhizosphaerae TaxID=390241 RepID=A0A1H9LM05_9SPHI|nr:GxxExxY protein [Pedobacter rhizosphaerae]SER12511.1 GxxExxY protein [Pedobacter rhizosphaerae]
MTKREITELSYAITGCAIRVHKNLGPGLLESVYEKCLKYELEKEGFMVQQQLNVELFYDDLIIDTALRVDLFVNNLVVIELKTVERIMPVHEAQLMTYMKLLVAPQGLLINFYTDNISKSLRALVNDFFKILPP